MMRPSGQRDAGSTDSGGLDVGVDAGADAEDGGSSANGNTGEPAAGCASSGECEQHIEVTTAAHALGTIPYADRPPVGGMHNPCWARWGVHEQAVAAENWVHNLEHGGVVVLYNCDGTCAGDVDRLEGFVAARPRALLTEYTAMDSRFAIVAWEYRLVLDNALDLDAFAAFYAAHAGHGPENITAEPGASCN